jgi:hypothetical protein
MKWNEDETIEDDERTRNENWDHEQKRWLQIRAEDSDQNPRPGIEADQVNSLLLDGLRQTDPTDEQYWQLT